MSRDEEGAKIDPSNADGLYKGPSRGHVQTRYAQRIGLPREYGYGASMGAWALNYVAHWSGDAGFIRHSDLQYRFPPFEDDITVLRAEVVDKGRDAELGADVASLSLTMSNQDDTVIARGTVQVELPK